jgi:hypothetical protein
VQFVQRDSATGERAKGLDQQFARLRDELISMVQAGIGVTVLSEVSRSLIPPDLVLLPLHPQTSRRLVLTGPRARPWHPAVRTLADSALDHLAAAGAMSDARAR